MRHNRKTKHLNSYLHISLYKDDMEKLQQDRARSTCRTMSAYCRKVLLGRPPSDYYRDRSFDAFIEEAIALRKEMQTIREKLSFTHEGEERFIALQVEIKSCINKIFDHVRKNIAK